MKGWSRRQRLLWYRRSHSSIPLALLGFVILSLLVSASFVMPGIIHSLDPKTPQLLSDSTRTDEVLRIASSLSPLTATVTSSMIAGHPATCIVLNNSGSGALSSVIVADARGEVLGILARLSPGESQTIITDADGDISIGAMDSLGRRIPGMVIDKRAQAYTMSTGYGGSSGSGGSSSSGRRAPEPVVSGEPQTVRASIPAAYEEYAALNDTALNDTSLNDASLNRAWARQGLDRGIALNDTSLNGARSKGTLQTATHSLGDGSNEVTSVVSAPNRGSSGLCLYITADKTEALEGDRVGYKCRAVNIGQEVFYGVELSCSGKMGATGFLEPGQETHIDGSLEVHNSTPLSASVQCKDPEGRWMTNNTSLTIWRVSPELQLTAEGPSEKVHRGDQVSIRVTAKNAGERPLKDLCISSSLGEIGRISILGPGESRVLQKNISLEDDLDDRIRAIASGDGGREVYASSGITLSVLRSALDLQVEPSEIVAYPGEPVEVVLAINNTGEEVLRNVTLMEDGAVKARLREIAPGKSVRVAAVYSPDRAARLNLSAIGYDVGGYPAADSGRLVIRAVSPGISLEVSPSHTEACSGQEIDITCIVANRGNDLLSGIVLRQDGLQAAKVDRLAPGDFRVFGTKVTAESNRTITFRAEGSDSRSRPWSDQSQVNISLVNYAIKLSATADPESVPAGGRSMITCTVENPSNVSLHDIFLISRSFGPLGSIDFIAPRSKKVLSVEENIEHEVRDLITAEGFTSDKESVRDRCDLLIELIQDSVQPGGGSAYGGGSSPVARDPEPAQASAGAGDGSSMSSGLEEDLSPESVQGKSSSGAKVPGDTSLGSGAVPSMAVPAGDASDQAALKPHNQSATGSVPLKARIQSSGPPSKSMLGSDGSIGGLVQYIERMMEQVGLKASESARRAENTRSAENTRHVRNTSEDYILGIESIKGSEKSAIRILDVNAMPPKPAANAPVKISVHVQGDRDIEAVALQWGLAVTATAKQNALGVERAFTTRMALDSEDGQDSYWSCTIPGHSAGTYMVISVTATDGSGTAENGPFMLRWNDVDFKHAQGSVSHNPTARTIQNTNGLLYIESTSVSGRGEVSIKDRFHESSMNYEEKMKGFGSVNIESIRTVDKGVVVNFTERRDLLFEGQIKGRRSLESPSFHNGLGASVSERFNLTRIDKTETDMIRSIASTNNTIAFRTEQAFDGMWNIRTQYSQFDKKIKADQKYTGQFQTSKNIQFQD